MSVYDRHDSFVSDAKHLFIVRKYMVSVIEKTKKFLRKYRHMRNVTLEKKYRLYRFF